MNKKNEMASFCSIHTNSILLNFKPNESTYKILQRRILTLQDLTLQIRNFNNSNHSIQKSLAWDFYPVAQVLPIQGAES